MVICKVCLSEFIGAEGSDCPYCCPVKTREWLNELDGNSRIAIQNIAHNLGNLVAEKNEAYGNSFMATGEILKVLFPNGISPDKYTDALLLARILDKCMRIATRKEAFGESPYSDIAGYGICGVKKDKEAGK